MIEVDRFPLIFPPRPQGAILPSTLERYQDRGIIAQYKYNDIRALFHLEGDGALSVVNRRRQPIRSFRIDAPLLQAFCRIRTRPGCLYLFDGGILRSTLPSTGRHAVVLWDLLVCEDRYLLNTTYDERYQKLFQMAGRPRRQETDSGRRLGLLVGPGLWLAENFRDDFTRHFETARSQDHLEGLMLKNLQGRLQWGTREENNGSWQIRVRKTNGRHVF